MDEYHLIGIALDMYVKWERRAPSSGDGRGENRSESRGDGKPKLEQKKFEDGHFTEGLVSLALQEPFPPGATLTSCSSSVPKRAA